MEEKPPPRSPPPSYSESEPGKQSPKIVKLVSSLSSFSSDIPDLLTRKSHPPLPRGDPDLEICSHPHELLASINMADQNLATVLHHWEGVSTEETTGTPSLAIRTSLSLNSLQHIRGFRDLGTCWLPGTEVTDETRVHNHFTSLIPEDDGGKKSLEVSSDADIISRILKRVRNTPSSPQDVPIQLFAISVLSNNGTGALFTGGPFPLWKWVKPESVYSEFSLRGVLASNWETDMEKLIAKGEWTAGKDLQLLLRGVSEERGEEHSASNDRWKTITDIWRCG